MIRPSSRSCSCNWVSKWWQAWGVRSALRNWTMRRPIWVITGIKRTVSGNKEVAKGVASRGRTDVAWSIEATFLVKQPSQDLVLFREEVASFSRDQRDRGGTQGPLRSQTAQIPPKTMALTRSHPLDSGRWSRSPPASSQALAVPAGYRSWYVSRTRPTDTNVPACAFYI